MSVPNTLSDFVLLHNCAALTHSELCIVSVYCFGLKRIALFTPEVTSVHGFQLHCKFQVCKTDVLGM